MDDEGEVRDMNLSSRPKREERRRQRERDRLEREMDRDHRADGGQASSLEWSSVGWDGGDKPCVLQPCTPPSHLLGPCRSSPDMSTTAAMRARVAIQTTSACFCQR